MTKRIFFTLIVSLAIAKGANCQIDSEIRSYVDSAELLVNNGRKMLLNKVEERDFVKVKEIYQYLSDQTSNSRYSAFDYTEDVYINMLLNDWYELAECMIELDEGARKMTYQGKIEIKPVLFDKIIEFSDSLRVDCMNSEIDDESKKVIVLLLQLFESGPQDKKYNEMLREYRKEYKTSTYESFLSKYMPGSGPKASIAFSFGSGMNMVTDKLADNFTSAVTVNMSFDMNINKVFSSIFLNGCSPKLKVPFSGMLGDDTLSFKRDDNFSFICAGLKGGYFLVRSERVHIAPFVSLSGTGLHSNYFEDPDTKEFEVFSSFCTGPGLHTEIKLGDLKYMSAYGSPRYLSIKLEAGYNFITSFKDKNYKGNSPYFIIALVMGAGNF